MHLKNIKAALFLFALVLPFYTSLFAQCTTPISSFPYVEDFETGPSWTTGGSPCTPLGLVINDWQWGHPIKNVINGAGSGYKCWIVGDTSGWFYYYGERSWVESPCFNFTSVQRPYIQFKIFWESEWQYDGTVLQYSLNGGTSWTDVGAYGDPTNCMDTNWFNQNNITNLGSYSHSLPGHGSASQTYPSLCTGTSTNGWCGNIQSSYRDTTGVSTSTCQGGHGFGRWLTAKHCMPYLAGHSSVIFRFAYGAGTSCNNFNGFAFDSVAIGEGTPNSADFTSTCVNTNTLHFSGLAPLCPDTFQWNFGDPASGSSNTVLGAGNLNPTHTFSAPGTYNVTFTVKGGPCNAPGSVTKAVNVIGVASTTVPAGCSAGGGSAIALVTGNVAPYSYAWSTTPVQHTDTATALAVGTYTVTVTCAGACSATASATIISASALSHTVSTTQSTCGSANGSATVTESGGTPAYTYLWSNGLGVSNSISGVAAGAYVLSVTDSHGCTDTVHVMITNGGGITASVSSQTNLACAGDSNGSIAVSVSGGTGPYVYHWSITDSSTVGLNSQLRAGTYVITVTEAGGNCSATVSATLTQPAPLSHSVSTTATACGAANGAATVTESGGAGGYSYAWSGGLGTTNSISSVAAGTYTLTITDSHSCQEVVTVTIANSGGVSATLGSSSNVSCPGGNNGSITINASGGTLPYSYHWGTSTTTSNTQSGFSAGNYVITVTDAGGCLTTVGATINQPPAFAHISSVTPATCGANNGKAQIIFSGGTPSYTFLWSAGMGTTDSITSAAPGTYILSMTDALGCLDTAIVAITSTGVLTAVLDSASPVSCNGGTDGSITVSASGGLPPYTYHWGSSSTLANVQGGFSAGTYLITVTDNGGCSATVSATVTQPAILTALATSVNEICHSGANGSVTVIVNGGNPAYSYTWSNTAQTTAVITGLSANTYAVTVTDLKGCQIVTSSVVSQPSALTITFPIVTDDSCSNSSDGSASAMVSGSTPGYTYLWSTGATGIGISSLAAGTYSITVSDTNHCTASATVDINSALPLVLTASSTPVLCFNDSDATATVSVSGGTAGYRYLWSTGGSADMINNLPAGNYSVTVTDAFGCTAVAPAVSITNPSPITVSANVINQSCVTQNDGSINLTTSGGTPAFSYTWVPTAGNTPNNTGLSAGEYYFTVTDANGCSMYDSAAVALSPPLLIQSNVKQPACPPLADGNITVLVSGGNPAYTYLWNNGVLGDSNQLLSPGTYTVTATDTKGCTVTASYTLSYLGSFVTSAGINDTINLGETITLSGTTNPNEGDINYFWSPDYHLSCQVCSSTIASPLQTITYYVTAKDSNGCSSTDSVVVYVNPNYILYIPNAFTPNGNGVNDYFEVYGNKESWKYFNVKIYNRWGEKLFESNDEDFTWDGRYKGEMQEPGIYVYLIELTFIDGHSTGLQKGSITLVR